MGGSERKMNIPMCLAFILLCLTLMSIHLTSGLYARYTTTSTGSDSARVAKFDVGCTVQPVMDENNETVEGRFTLTVTNNSEVAVKYSIEVELPASLSVAVGDSEAKNAADGKPSVTFTDANWILAPNAETPAEHALQFAVVDWVGFTDPNEGPDATEQVKLDFKVNVHAEQID